MAPETDGRRVALDMLEFSSRFNDEVEERVGDPYLARNEVVMVLCRLLVDGNAELASIDRLLEGSMASSSEVIAELDARALVEVGGGNEGIRLTDEGREAASAVVGAFTHALRDAGLMRDG